MTVALDPAESMAATDVIDSDHESVRQVADKLTLGATGAADRVRALFEWVRDEIRYDMGPVLSRRSDWTASSTIDRGYGFCQQKAVLLAALLRAADVPSGIGVEVLFDHKIPPHFAEYMGGRHIPLHGYTLAFVEGRWQRIDATLDFALCERKRYRVVQYAPGADRQLPATDLDGKPHVEHLAVVGEWSDLPEGIVLQTLALPYLQDSSFLQMASKHGPGM